MHNRTKKSPNFPKSTAKLSEKPRITGVVPGVQTKRSELTDEERLALHIVSVIDGSKGAEIVVAALDGISNNPLARGKLSIIELVIVHVDNGDPSIQKAAQNCLLQLLVRNEETVINHLLKLTDKPASTALRCSAIQALAAAVDPVQSRARDLDAERQAAEAAAQQLAAYRARADELEAQLRASEERRMYIRPGSTAGAPRLKPGASLRGLLKGRTETAEARIARELSDLRAIIRDATADDAAAAALREHGAPTYTLNPQPQTFDPEHQNRKPKP